MFAQPQRIHQRFCAGCRRSIKPGQSVFMYNDRCHCSQACRLRAFEKDCLQRRLDAKRQSRRRRKKNGSHRSSIDDEEGLGSELDVASQASQGSQAATPEDMPLASPKTPFVAIPPAQAECPTLAKAAPGISARIVGRGGTKSMKALGFRTILVQLQEPVPTEFVGGVTACTIKWFAGMWRTQLAVACCKASYQLEALLVDGGVPETSIILLEDMIRMRSYVKYNSPNEMSSQIKKDIYWCRTLLGQQSSSKNDVLPTCRLCALL
uniref:FLZ-type domain-containing protein n=1 Tax=Lotharella oceanica TaxID=641309 RepID=A0A7S2TXL6_9EUKA|mmetsp:Transcript_34439/g.63817  ORF Transcript_34439/g.63817 Transcript_34439/m.63817 type:complete len:265 (+) Transcript_34439:78-872(+)